MPIGLLRLSWSARLVASCTTLALCVATVPATVVAATVVGATVVGATVVAAAPEDPPSTAAEATPVRAAILPVAIEGDELPEADREQLNARLVDGLRRGNVDVVTPAEVAKANPGAASCRDAACFTAIARATGATHVVLAVVQAQDRDYEVEVLLLDGRDGAQVAAAADRCQICGVAEVADLLDAAAATLRTKLDALAQGPATLVVASDPVGASISIDGELKGTTPFNAPVLAGKHVLRISLEGYITLEREVTFVEGIEETQSFELEKVPSRLPPRPWGWVSLGLGIAGIGTAVAFTVLDDLPYQVGGACDAPDPRGECPDLWDTEWIGFSTAIVGAGLATLGVAILLNSAKRRGKKTSVDTKASASRRPHFGVGPKGVSLRGRF